MCMLNYYMNKKLLTFVTEEVDYFSSLASIQHKLDETILHSTHILPTYKLWDDCSSYLRNL